MATAKQKAARDLMRKRIGVEIEQHRRREPALPQQPSGHADRVARGFVRLARRSPRRQP